MEQISSLVASLAESETLAMSQKSNQLRSQGVDVINLSVGEPDFNTPEHIKEAAKKAIDENFTFYTPVAGYLSLREAICKKLKNENHLDYASNQIACSNGAKQALCNTILAILNPEDEIIIPAPSWVSYVEMVKLARAKSIVIETTLAANFKITPAQLEKHITSKTKAILLCSPSNPTGSVYSKDELESLANVLKNYPNIIIISDEIYEHINYVGKHHSLAQFDFLKDRTVIINGVSKAYAMTGWRLGWMAGPKWIVDACVKLQGQYSSGCSSIAQKAAEAAYLGSDKCVVDMREAFRRRKNLMLELMKQISGFKINDPEGAFYMFPDCSYYLGKSYDGKKINTSNELAMLLLEKAHVACVGGMAFGAPNNIRFSYATSDEKIIEAMKRIKELLSELY